MELKDAKNIYHRICNTFVDDCFDCPFSKANIRCDLFDTSEVDEEEIAEWERVATEWAREHPEPKYPTIGDMLYFIANEMNVSIFKPKGENLSDFLNSELPEKVSNRLIGWLIKKGEK